MRILVAAGAVVTFALIGSAQSSGPYKVLKTAKVGGVGAFDYVYADANGRKLYIPRPGNPNPRVTVYDLDTLAPAGEIPGANARGVAVSVKSGHGFASSKPVTMFDTKDLTVIRKIDVDGGPDRNRFTQDTGLEETIRRVRLAVVDRNSNLAGAVTVPVSRNP
jgi:hypothetical protein